MTTEPPPPRDPSEHLNSFEFGLTVLNTQVIGIQIRSESRWQNWAATTLIFTLLLIVVAGTFAPMVVDLLQAEGAT